MTPEERRRVLRVAEGLQEALWFVPREMFDTAVRLSIRELHEIVEAHPSPAKDPIADAVHNYLQPLADELIKEGHKLAKEPR